MNNYVKINTPFLWKPLTANKTNCDKVEHQNYTYQEKGIIRTGAVDRYAKNYKRHKREFSLAVFMNHGADGEKALDEIAETITKDELNALKKEYVSDHDFVFLEREV